LYTVHILCFVYFLLLSKVPNTALFHQRPNTLTQPAAAPSQCTDICVNNKLLLLLLPTLVSTLLCGYIRREQLSSFHCYLLFSLCVSVRYCYLFELAIQPIITIYLLLQFVTLHKHRHTTQCANTYNPHYTPTSSRSSSVFAGVASHWWIWGWITLHIVHIMCTIHRCIRPIQNNIFFPPTLYNNCSW